MGRRLLRFAFNALAMLSLVLCVAAVATMIVFPRGIERVVYDGSFGWANGTGVAVGGIGLVEYHAYAGPIVVFSMPRSILNVTAFAATILPVAWLARRIKRPQPGHCRACAYDLTGNVSGTCPECGTPTPDFHSVLK